MLYCFREVKCRQGFTTGTWYYLYNYLGVTINMCISGLMVSALKFRNSHPGSLPGRRRNELTLQLFLRVLMKKLAHGTEGRGSMVKCEETPLERDGHVKTPWGPLCRMVLGELLNTCWGIFRACLLLGLKSWSARAASHSSAFIGNCRTISHTFCSPIYSVDEGNEDVGSVWDNI